jgi:outer membrane autotransporter protein
MLALCVGTWINPALAANECGLATDGASGSSVSCPASPDSYPAGIGYFSVTDLTVDAPAGVTVATTGVLTPGISLISGAAATLTGAASVSTTGDVSNGVDVASGFGPASATVGNVSTSGALSIGVYAAAGVDQNATIIAHTLTTTGSNNIGAFALSTVGNAAITTTGDVVGTGLGNYGLIAVSGAGNAAITANNVSIAAADPAQTASGGNAIIALGASATVIVTGTATTTGSAGAFGIASGNAVTAIATAGTALVTVMNAGTSADAANAVAAMATGGDADVTINGRVVTGGAAADAVSAMSTTGIANVTNAGQIATMGAGSRGIYAFGAGGVTVTNTGTLNGTTYALETAGGPAIVSNSGVINGSIALDGGNDVVANSGTFNASGTSTFAAGDTFNNSGVVAIAAIGGVPASVTFAGLGTFANTGRIELRDGVVGDLLTIAGNYVGSGKASLGIDIAPSAALVSDLLNVGGTTTGSTNVEIALAPGAHAVFNTYTTFVQAGAPSPANAFVVDPNRLNFGLVRYGVVYDPVHYSYALVAVPGDPALEMLGYQTAEMNLWYKSADAVSGQLQSRRDALWTTSVTSPQRRFWVTMAGSVDNARGYRDFGLAGPAHVTRTGYQQDYFGGQLGYDLAGGIGTRGGFAVGLTGGYINSNLNLGAAGDSVRFDAANAGVYAALTSGRIFATALGKYDFYWANPQSSAAGFNLHTHGYAYGVRGELGLRLGADILFIEPLAQISYIRTAFDPFDVSGTSVAFADRNGLRGRLGARIGGQSALAHGAKLAFYVGGNYVHDFEGTGEVSLSNSGGTYTFHGVRLRDFGEALLGVNIATIGAIDGFMEATYKHSFTGGADGQLTEEGFGGRAGIRVTF